MGCALMGFLRPSAPSVAAAPSPAPMPEPEVDWAGMWGDYSTWVGEAGERFEARQKEITRTPGLGDEARQRELTEATAARDKDLRSFQEGPTYKKLRGRFEEQGSPGGDMEAYFRSEYGGYEPKSSSISDPAAPGLVTKPGLGLSSSDDAANIVGIGSVRPWWQA